VTLERNPEKWIPVFPRDKRGTRLRGDHAQAKKIERDDDSKKSHRALVLKDTVRQLPAITNVCGYGSLLSQGRQQILAHLQRNAAIDHQLDAGDVF
jgi:uncharacterized membrane protein